MCYNSFMKTNPRVDLFIDKAKQWQKEYEKLREIVLSTGLTEEYKWMHPCYTFNGHNVIIIHGFKDYCAILFVKGALLKDPKKILIQQTENVQAGRQIRFTDITEIDKQESTIKSYIREAIEIEKAGLEVPHKKTSDFKVPEEFQKELDHNSALKTAFDSLTPGRQRAYLLYFSAPKQSATRSTRIEKSIDKIIDGIGLNDG